MGKQKQEDPPAGSPAWMATFSDLMNLLLCFFVLLFSMSSVDAEKFEIVINSFQEAFSILPSGGATLTEGTLISSGISQLPDFSNYFGDTMSKGDGEDEIDAGDLDEEGTEAPAQAQKTEEEQKAEAMEEALDQLQQEKLSESEAMAEKIEALATQYGIQDLIEVDFNGQYVRITLNGALLFDSGQSELKKEAVDLVEKISKILNIYTENTIEVEGYTDNVPIHSQKYEDNDVLSMYRALHVANMIRSNTSLDPGNIVSSGRGEYHPVADNSTSKGRARNRRVEIKIFNNYSEDDLVEKKKTEASESKKAKESTKESTDKNSSGSNSADKTGGGDTGAASQNVNAGSESSSAANATDANAAGSATDAAAGSSNAAAGSSATDAAAGSSNATTENTNSATGNSGAASQN